MKYIFSTLFIGFYSLFFSQFNLEKDDFWQVSFYEIEFKPNFNQKSVSGSSKLYFEITKDIQSPVFLIDLSEKMDYQIVNSSLSNYQEERKGNKILIHSKSSFKAGDKGFIHFSYNGHPPSVSDYESPWQNGWVFSKDEKGFPLMSVAQEHDGVSLWLPSKDVWYDEPENGIILKIIVPKELVGVGNGRLKEVIKGKEEDTYVWQVKNPINLYSIVPNVGRYVFIKDEFYGEKGKLDLAYWVLEGNEEKAKNHFKQVQSMLKAFEYWFGPYPFYEDSYKIVESPYLGMEHQSNIAYGNGFKNGYRGTDLSGTGVGLSWDFIIVHESGHEWFANNITAKDIADMWIHESFTCYSETLFTELYMDKTAANQYVQGIRKNILNDIPIIGEGYGLRKTGSGDMYYKGANMLHTIRTVINNDRVFRQILRGLNNRFYHQTVTSKEVESYIIKQSGIDFSSIFNQYLRTTKIPILEYQQKGKELKFRFQNVVNDFYLPIRINENIEIIPTENWQTITLPNNDKIEWNKNYYVEFRKM